MQKKQLALAALAVLGLAVAGVASAAPVTMTFDELDTGTSTLSGQYVANYYNGGCGAAFTPAGFGQVPGPVTCGGPNYGAVWTGALAQSSANPTVQDPPTTPNVISGPATLNVANGFTGTFSFDYASFGAALTQTITLYSDLDGGGTALFSAVLPKTFPGQGGCTVFGCWDPFTAEFSGIAKSAVFGATANLTHYDNVSFDMAQQPPVGVPEPGVLGMFGFGALLIGGGAVLARRRRAGEA